MAPTRTQKTKAAAAAAAAAVTTPNEETTAAGPSTSRNRQPSRKSKSSWRKNIDLTEVDEHLESQRAAERMGLTDTNGDIFAVDTTGDDEVRQRLKRRGLKKPMKSLQALQNTSAVKPITARKGMVAPHAREGMYGTKIKSTGKMSRVEQDRLRRIAGRPVKGPFGAIVESEQGNALESIKGSVLRVPAEDAWRAAEAAKEQAAAAKTGKGTTRARRPHESNDGRESLAEQASGATPLSVPSTGQSYNPTLASHSSLLQRAYEIEKSKMEAEEKERAFKDVWRQAAQVQAGAEMGASRFAGMIVGDGEDGSESEGSADDDDDDESSSSDSVTAQPTRKTRDQRKRAERAKAQDALAAQKREAKALRHHLSQLPTLEKQLKRQLSARQAALDARRASKLARVKSSGLSGQRMGKYRVPEDLLAKSANDVQLGEDLSEGLRGVKPEGNLFRDRWDSLVARGKAEYRRPVSEVGKGRRKRGSQRVKEYETHAYKRFV